MNIAWKTRAVEGGSHVVIVRGLVHEAGGESDTGINYSPGLSLLTKFNINTQTVYMSSELELTNELEHLDPSIDSIAQFKCRCYFQPRAEIVHVTPCQNRSRVMINMITYI